MANFYLVYKSRKSGNIDYYSLYDLYRHYDLPYEYKDTLESMYDLESTRDCNKAMLWIVKNHPTIIDGGEVCDIIAWEHTRPV